MMNWFSSGVSFIIQAILVVAAVLVFAFIDPFNILVNNKLTLTDTPAHVVKIREIGELITAEYYGEVITSYQTLIEVTKQEEIDSMKSQVTRMDLSFRDRVFTLLPIEKRHEQRKQFNAILEDFDSLPYFNLYLNKLKDQVKKGKVFTTLFRRLVIDSGIEDLDENQGYLTSTINDAKALIEKNYRSRKISKPQLIMVGRGKVTAGYRFGTLDKHNIRFDTVRNKNLIVLVGMNAEILSWDINPWFIPELGIKGYEIVDVNRQANNPDILKKVKKACKDLLMSQAMASEILKKAKINAEQNLKQFLSLVLDNPALEVRIESDELDYYSNYVLHDSLVIDPDQLSALAKLINDRWAENQKDSVKLTDKPVVDSVKIASLLDTLCKTRLLIGKNTYLINPNTLLAYQGLHKNMGKSVLDTNELKDTAKLKKVADSIKLHLDMKNDKFRSLYEAALLRNKVTSVTDTSNLYPQMLEMAQGLLWKK
jgi:hypothetical protein